MSWNAVKREPLGGSHIATAQKLSELPHVYSSGKSVGHIPSRYNDKHKTLLFLDKKLYSNTLIQQPRTDRSVTFFASITIINITVMEVSSQSTLLACRTATIVQCFTKQPFAPLCGSCMATPAAPNCNKCGCDTCVHTISYTTEYDTFCSTGLAKQVYAVTETYRGMPSKPTVTSADVPFGFTAEVQTCTTCGPTPVVATITRPVSEVVQDVRASGVITIPAGIDPQYSLFSMTDFPSAALPSESTRVTAAQDPQGLVLQSGSAPDETLPLRKDTSLTASLHGTVTAHESNPDQIPTLGSLNSGVVLPLPTTASLPITNTVSGSTRQYGPAASYKCVIAAGLVLMTALMG
ncbi:uncharacterized protein CLUP02_12673 [Colletotrichum lupini]|uniref:Uncharacterized protein n=1 Tax=Colletotrichum lupini TaxID=145971 RepID=A0A9Q8WLH6_9PEZI|nr:uncharacterized protein CLUP02_12673 [Colletotrichum lupini]UQC87172.1 hypothetical protein CLUP02_12673 [Colletotrichum lupini]